ncbi:hypothetical protein [Actinophytocola oryzae]|nr:hypothetical protein [Actinophytocola oryzae]
MDGRTSRPIGGAIDASLHQRHRLAGGRTSHSIGAGVDASLYQRDC